MTVTALLLSLACGAIAIALALGWLATARTLQPAPVRLARKR